MNFRSAKGRPKIEILGSEGQHKAICDAGRRIGRGPSEGQESAEVRVKVRHALAPRSARRGRRISRAPPYPPSSNYKVRNHIRYDYGDVFLFCYRICCVDWTKRN